jgi:hypothetical protein
MEPPEYAKDKKTRKIRFQKYFKILSGFVLNFN